jgi:ribonuclease HI
MFYVFVDGSYEPKKETHGIGIVIAKKYDSDIKILKAIGYPVIGASLPNEIELIAMSEAIKLMKLLNLSPSIFLTDSSFVTSRFRDRYSFTFSSPIPCAAFAKLLDENKNVKIENYLDSCEINSRQRCLLHNLAHIAANNARREAKPITLDVSSPEVIYEQ